MKMHRSRICLTSSDWNLPYTNLVVAIASEQSLSVSWPGEWQALWWIGLWRIISRDSRTKFLNHLLACQIPNFNRRSIGDTQPVAIGREAQGIDDVVVVQSVQVLAIIQIPQQSLAILATGSAQWSIGRDSDGVQISIVSIVVQLQLAICQIPDLNGAIPATADDDWIDLIWRKTNARDPVRVTIFLNGVLALGEGVPQLDGLIAWAWHNLTVVSWEGNWEDVLKLRENFALEMAQKISDLHQN